MRETNYKRETCQLLKPLLKTLPPSLSLSPCTLVFSSTQLSTHLLLFRCCRFQFDFSIFCHLGLSEHRRLVNKALQLSANSCCSLKMCNLRMRCCCCGEPQGLRHPTNCRGPSPPNTPPRPTSTSSSSFLYLLLENVAVIGPLLSGLVAFCKRCLFFTVCLEENRDMVPPVF